jgi:hypothetical protein
VPAFIMFFFSLGFYILTMIIMLVYGISSKELDQDIERDIARGKAGDFYLVGLPLMFLASYILLCRSVWSWFGHGTYVNCPESASILTWLMYGCDGFLGIVLFDAPEAYGFKLTDITPVRQFWPATLAFSFKLALSIGLLKILFASIEKVLLRRREQAAASG